MSFLDIPVTPEQLQAFFTHLPVAEQFMFVAGAAFVIGSFGGWLVPRSWDRDNVKHWRDLVDWYKTKAGAFSNSEAIARLLTRMEALPETTLTDAEIVGELREGLRGIRDSEKVFAESIALTYALIASTQSSVMTTIILLSTVVLALTLTLGLWLKYDYEQFPNPLSPTEMADLANQLRNDEGGPQ